MEEIIMKRYKFTGLIFFVLLAGSIDSIAQNFSKKYRYKGIGLNINSMNYVGEVDPSPSFLSPSISHTKYNIGFAYLYKIKPHLAIRGNVSYGRIKGDDYKNASYSIEDIHRKMRNVNFRNEIYEIKLDAVIDLIGNYMDYRKRPDFTPYVFFGIAYFHHNPQGLSPDNEWVYLKPLSTEGQGLPGTGVKEYSLHQIAIPFGFGVRYKLARYWDLGFEIGWRYTFTDYLDDVGGVYSDKDLIRKEKGYLAADMSDRAMEALAKDAHLKDFVENRQGGYVAKNNGDYDGTGDLYINSYNTPGAKRGDKNKDWYILTGFHLVYIFPPKVICPKFRR